MADIRVDQLTVFPIKSLGGVSVRKMQVSELGPDLDRRWMLVDERGLAITQRENPILSQCRIAIDETSIAIECGEQSSNLPLEMVGGESIKVEIWGDQVEAVQGPVGAADWFSELLESRCFPVYMPPGAVRSVNPRFAPGGSYTSFTDGFPVLVASMSSLEDLNRRLESDVPMGRFRANVVVTGAEPFAEDRWDEVRVGTTTIRGVKPCSRCVMTTIDPTTLSKSKEPLRTLATFRKFGNHVYFAENFIVEDSGEICIGDKLTIESVRSSSEVARSRI